MLLRQLLLRSDEGGPNNWGEIERIGTGPVYDVAIEGNTLVVGLS